RQQLANRILFLGAWVPLDSPEFDPLFEVCSLNNSIHENARRMDLIGVKLTDFDKLLNLRNANLATAGDHRIEVSRGFSINQVAGLISLPCFDERDFRGDARFEDVFFTVETLRLFALSKFGPKAGAGIKTGNS